MSVQFLAVGEPGRAALELGAGLPPAEAGDPDHMLSEYQVSGVDIRGASVRGLMHRYREEPRQDAFSVVHDPESETTVVVVCDGVGSLENSHRAARFVTEQLPSAILAGAGWEAAVSQVNTGLGILAQSDTESSADEVSMATTVSALTLKRTEDGLVTEIAWIGDSPVWHLGRKGWTPLTEQLENPSDAVHTGSVRALPTAEPGLQKISFVFDQGAIFVMTDGVGGPLMDSSEVRVALQTWWAEPPEAFEFGRQVGFARRGHLDDRTVVGLWLRDD